MRSLDGWAGSPESRVLAVSTLSLLDQASCDSRAGGNEGGEVVRSDRLSTHCFISYSALTVALPAALSEVLSISEPLAPYQGIGEDDTSGPSRAP